MCSVFFTIACSFLTENGQSMNAVLLLFFFFDQISGTELEAGKGRPEAAEGSQEGKHIFSLLNDLTM